MKSCLITGINGYIGKNLSAYLMTHGYSIRGSLRRADIIMSSEISVYQTGDIDGATNWAAPLQDVEIVFHLASIVHRSDIQDFQTYHQTIVEATVALAKQAILANVKKFIYISSMSVYPAVLGGDLIVESKAENPATPYGIAKLTAERELQKLMNQSSMEIVIVRPPLVYGKGAPGNMAQLIKLIRKFPLVPLGAAVEKRSFVGIENLVDFLRICAENPHAANKIFNVSDDDDIAIHSLCRLLARFMGKKGFIFYVPKLIMKLGLILVGKKDIYDKLFEPARLDISQAKKCLNWVPKYTLESQLEKLLS